MGIQTGVMGCKLLSRCRSFAPVRVEGTTARARALSSGDVGCEKYGPTGRYTPCYRIPKRRAILLTSDGRMPTRKMSVTA